MDTRRILVIAGSDSSGGAGLEADQKVIAVNGCYAMTATTALTAQNTKGVSDIHIIPTAFVTKQIDVCIEDIGVDIVKTGMLASTETVHAVAEAFKRHNITKSVVDPVVVSTSGAQLLPEEAVSTLRKELLPQTLVLTPNIPEAALLLRNSGTHVKDPSSVDDLCVLAKAVRELGPKYVLLKGGHLPLSKDRIVSRNETDRHVVVDVLCGPTDTQVFESEYIASKNTHGTGCSLASSIASHLAHNNTIHDAVTTARSYITAGICTAVPLGHGSGPISHFHSTYTLPFAPNNFIPYLLSHPLIAPYWHRHLHHPFVTQLGAGTLSLPAFRHYMTQDYLFLVSFARANALAAYKAASILDIAASASNVAHIEKEMSLHLEYCASFGLSKADIEATTEDLATVAYTRFVLDIGNREDWFALQIALAPCLLGYGAIAERVFNDAESKREGNPYWRWVEQYVSEDFRDAVGKGREVIERHAAGLSVRRVEALVGIFARATALEVAFWDMGLQAGGES